MPTLRLELPARPSRADLEALQAGLAAYGQVDELPPVSYDFQSFALGVSLVSDVLQAAGVLVGWLKRTPRGNQAVIRLADGRTLKMATTGDADADAFLQALRAALKEFKSR